MLIEDAVSKTIAKGFRTADIYVDGFKKADTKTMTAEVLDNI